MTISRREFLRMSGAAGAAVLGRPLETVQAKEKETYLNFKIGNHNFSKNFTELAPTLLAGFLGNDPRRRSSPAYRTPTPNRILSSWERRKREEEKKRKIRRLLVGATALTGGVALAYKVVKTAANLLAPKDNPIIQPRSETTPLPTPKPQETPPIPRFNPEEDPTNPKQVNPLATPEVPKIPREDMYQPGTAREFMLSWFHGSSGYIDYMATSKNTIDVYQKTASLFGDITLPDYIKKDPKSQMRLFAYSWEQISQAFSYQRPDPYTPVDKLPSSIREENYSQELLTHLGIILQLQGEEVNKANLLYLVDIINFQRLMLDPNYQKDYFLYSGDYPTIQKEIGELKGPVYPTSNQATLKLLNWQLTLKYLFQFQNPEIIREGKTEKFSMRDYIRKSKPPIALEKMPDGVALDNYLSEYAQKIIAANFPATSLSAKEPSPLTTEPATEQTVVDVWASIINRSNPNIKTHITARDAKILKLREGGSPEITDGIFQVTKATRESTYMRIPYESVKALLNRSALLNGQFAAEIASDRYKGSIDAFFSTDSNLNKVRKAILDNYSYSPNPSDPNDGIKKQAALEIQTFWGLWFFSYACKPYGEYLSFLAYNYPAGVIRMTDEITKATGKNKEAGIQISNQLVQAVDNFLYEKPNNIGIKINKVEIDPSLLYEYGRGRFFWHFDLNGIAEIEGKQISFTVPGAHYLWNANIEPQSSDTTFKVSGTPRPETQDEKRDKYTLRNYGEEGLQNAYASFAYYTGRQPNDDEKKSIRSLIFDGGNNPAGVLTVSSTGQGIMDIIHKM